MCTNKTVYVAICPLLEKQAIETVKAVILRYKFVPTRHCSLFSKPQIKIGDIMKTVKILTLVLFLILSFSTFAANNPYKEDKSDIEQAVTTFVKSIDNRKADDLSKTLLSNSSIIIVNSITNKIDNYTGQQMIDLVKNGQQGGWTRNVTVNSVDTDGNTAMAKVDITDSRLKQSGFFTLVKDNGVWKVASEVATLGLNK